MFSKKLTLLFAVFALIMLSAAAVLAQSEVIVSNDFEKGTQNWENRGAVSVSSSKDQAATGTKSLRVSGRREFWNGAQLNVTKVLVRGKSYKFTVSVKLAKGEKPDEIKMTMQRGDNQFEQVGSATINADEWTTISGKFKPTGDDPYLLVYIEAKGNNTAYFIDDFKIETLGDDRPSQSGVILQNDFEDMTAQNWTVRGAGVQMFSSNVGGSQNLKVSGRTQNSHGLALDVSSMLFKGRTYQIFVSVRLVKGQAVDSLKITMQQMPPKGEVKYFIITEPTKVTDGEWVTLSGQYTATTSDNNLLLYIEAAGVTTSFHIDNFIVKIP